MIWTYGWSECRRDLIAGLTVSAIAVPQAMAYALIAGIDPRFGLYSAIVVTALASIFGSSSHLINGPTNAISLVVFSAIAFIDPDARGPAFEATFLLAVMVGVVQIAIALFKLGDLTRYISDSVVLGFMAGAGFLVGLGQVANLLGVQERGTGHQHLLYRLWLTLTTGGVANPRAVGIGLGTVLAVWLLRKVLHRCRLPRIDMLLALIVAACVSAVLGWATPGPGGKTALAVIGNVPAGLPSFHIPDVESGWVREMAGSSIAIAFLGLLEALSIAKSIATKTRQPIDFNRQCMAEGLANLGGGFFQCLPGSGSLTRSAINFYSGAATRCSGIFSAAAVGLVMILIAPLARYIPKSALAGLLLITAAGLIDAKRMMYAVRVSRYDAILMLATALSAVFISVEFSILIGTSLSILMYVPRAARLRATRLAVNSDRVVRDLQKGEPVCSSMVILNLEGELFFGAAWELDRCFEELLEEVDDGVRVIVLRVKRTRNADLVCMERIRDFIQEMNARKVPVLLSGVRDDFADKLKRLGSEEWLPPDRLFHEMQKKFSSTLQAIRHAYELLGDNTCPHCAHRTEVDTKDGGLYYMI
jgi:SulP family sulfate permease